MNTSCKIQNKGQVTIPTVIRRQAGLQRGDLVNFAFQHGKVILTPRLVIDRPAVAGRKNRKQILLELATAVAELRQEAKEKGIDKMTKRQINAAVAAARRDLARSSKRPAK